MKFFVDTANIDQIEEAQDLGILDGVTTNPSLMAKEGISGKENCHKRYIDICELIDGPVSAEVILLPVILIPPAVKFDIPAIVVLLAPKLIDVVPIVIAEFARFAFVIPALPDNIEFVMLDSVLFEALIVLFVSVFDVPENKVSN